jgi:hypothetical protein
MELKKKPIRKYYPCWIIHFIGCVSAKYLHTHTHTFSQLIPSHIKLNACSFTDENLSRFF